MLKATRQDYLVGSASTTTEVVVSDGSRPITTLKLDNLWDDSYDVISSATGDLDVVLDALTPNHDGIAAATIKSVAFTADLSPVHRGARILDVSVPGGLRTGVNRVRTTVLRYGDPQPQTVTTDLTIPKGMLRSGSLAVTGAMGGGGDWSDGEDAEGGSSGPETVADIVADLQSLPKNTDLQVVYVPERPLVVPPPAVYPIVDVAGATPTSSVITGYVEKSTGAMSLRAPALVRRGTSARLRGVIHSVVGNTAVSIYRRVAGRDQLRVRGEGAGAHGRRLPGSLQLSHGRAAGEHALQGRLGRRRGVAGRDGVASHPRGGAAQVGDEDGSSAARRGDGARASSGADAAPRARYTMAAGSPPHLACYGPRSPASGLRCARLARRLPAPLGHRPLQPALHLLHAARGRARARPQRDPHLRGARGGRARGRRAWASARCASPAASRSCAAASSSSCAMLAAVEGISDLSLTTNGLLLPRFAADLAAAGLRRVNVSIDSLDRLRFAELTRGARLDQALAGLDAAFAAGFSPVKVNVVLLAGIERRGRGLRRAHARTRGARALHRAHAARPSALARG